MTKKQRSVTTYVDVLNAWTITLTRETARVYGGVIRALADSCGDPLVATSDELAAFIRGGGSHRMKQRRLSALHGFYRHALNSGAVLADPSRNLWLRDLDDVTNEDLLSQLGYRSHPTWIIVLHDALKDRKSSRWRSMAASTLLRRLLARARNCSTEVELLRLLRSTP